MLKHYKLIGRQVVECADWMEAVQYYEQPDAKILARTTIGEYDISTVFLMVDHRLFGEGPPIVFETMVFSPDDSDIGEWMHRYTSFQAALDGHNKVVDEVRAMVANSKEIAEQATQTNQEKSDD